jgi:Tol biopolymer transport system component
MKKFCFGLLCGSLLFSSTYAEVTKPIELLSNPSAHCQAPQWSPDGEKLAVNVYSPKKDLHEVYVLDLNGNRVSKKSKVKTTEQVSSLGGGKPAPILEFSWAPSMDMLSDPYIFSTQSVKSKNFDIYLDNDFITSHNKGNDGQAVIAPSQSYLAYVAQGKESGDIVLFSLEELNGKAMNPTPTTTEYLPSWSPNPEENALMFIRSQKDRGQDIIVVPDVTHPKKEIQLTRFAGDEIRPHWSPNGKRVAFYTNHKSKGDKVFDLWVVNANGKKAKKLVPNVIVDDHQGAVWSSDGQFVIFVKKDYKRNNPIMWIHVESGRSGIVTQKTQINSDLSIFYNEDGSMKLAYKAAGLQGSKTKTWERIFTVSFTLEDLK